MSQDEPAPREAVVIGVDIGTTSTKAVAFDTSGNVLASHSAGYELAEPEPGHAVQDPDEIYAAVLESIRETVSGLDGRAVYRPVVQLGDAQPDRSRSRTACRSPRC